jgi:hypothetical protein
MFFHRGDNGPFTAFTIGSMELRAAFAVFMNGASGFSIMPEFVAHFVPDDRPSLTWLAFVPHDAPVRRMLRAALANRVEVVWTEIACAALDPEEIRWIAQGLNTRGCKNDSVWLRARLADCAERAVHRP